MPGEFYSIGLKSETAVRYARVRDDAGAPAHLAITVYLPATVAQRIHRVSDPESDVHRGLSVGVAPLCPGTRENFEMLWPG